MEEHPRGERWKLRSLIWNAVWKLFGQERKLQGKISIKVCYFLNYSWKSVFFHVPGLNYGYSLSPPPKKKVWLIFQADINISVSTTVAFLKPCVWRVLSPRWWQRSFPTGKKVRVRTRTIQDRETLRGPRPSGRTAPGPQTPDGCPHGHGGEGRKRLRATPIVIQLWFFSNLKLLSIL